MIGVLWLLEAIVLGFLLAWRWIDLREIQPAWAQWLLRAGAGAAGGMGLASCLFFIFGVLLGSQAAAVGVELAALAWAIYECVRYRSRSRSATAPSARTPLLLALAALLAIVVATATIASGWDANPQGNWDAWAIWNLRARFLSSGAGLAPRAWAPQLGAVTHPEYPLLVSALAARSWTLTHSTTPAVPQAVSYLFFLSLLAVAAGGVAALRSPALGALAALILASTPSLVHEVPAQYADVPLACYFAGAVVLALLDQPMAAGIFAAFAAWTKDEGALFLLLFAAAILIFRRHLFRRAAAGALPVFLLLLVFKEGLASGTSTSLMATSLPGLATRLADAHRYTTILAAFGREVVNMGVGWYHPILPLAVAAIGLRFDRARSGDALFAAAIPLGLLAGYFGIYSMTANDLNWQLQTSLSRLLIQVWPVVLVACFAFLNAPRFAAAPVAEKKSPRPQTRNKRRR